MVIFKYNWNFLDQLLLLFKFYGRDMMGMYFFNFASCRVQSKASKAIALDAPTSCLDAQEISLLFCYTLTCNCLLKAIYPLKSALKMGARQISNFAAWPVVSH